MAVVKMRVRVCSRTCTKGLRRRRPSRREGVVVCIRREETRSPPLLWLLFLLLLLASSATTAAVAISSRHESTPAAAGGGAGLAGPAPPSIAGWRSNISINTRASTVTSHPVCLSSSSLNPSLSLPPSPLSPPPIAVDAAVAATADPALVDMAAS